MKDWKNLLVAVSALIPANAFSQVTEVTVSSGSPVRAFVDQLGNQGVGWPISLTSPTTRYPADNEFWCFVDFDQLPPRVEVSFQRTDLVNDPMGSARATLHSLVDAYNALDHVAKYEVRETERRFEVVATHLCEVGGHCEPYVSPLDIEIAIPHGKMVFGGALRRIGQELNQAGVGMDVGRGWSADLTLVRVGGTRTARAHLLSVLRQLDYLHRANETTLSTLVWTQSFGWYEHEYWLGTVNVLVHPANLTAAADPPDGPPELDDVWIPYLLAGGVWGVVDPVRDRPVFTEDATHTVWSRVQKKYGQPALPDRDLRDLRRRGYGLSLSVPVVGVEPMTVFIDGLDVTPRQANWPRSMENARRRYSSTP